MVELDMPAKNMDVLIIVPSISRIGGGVSEVVRLVNSSLREQPGVNTEIWSFWDAESEASLDLYGTTPVRLFRTFLSPRFGFAPQMIAALIRRRPALVYVHGLWMFHCLAVHLWSKLTGGKYSVVPHGMLEPWIMARSRRLKEVISRGYQNSFLKRACFVQALTVKEISDVDAVVTGCRKILVPNFVDVPEGLIPLPKWFEDALKGKKIFLFFGRIHAKKGCLELLRAWEMACQKCSEFKSQSRLVFAGWNDGLDAFQPAIEELELSCGNVRYVGPQYGEDKTSTLNAATFMVLPSYSEGLPMVVLEAWAAGRPALITAACNLPAGFSSDAAIEIFTEEAELAEALLTSFALSEDRLQAMSAAARKLVVSTYSRDAVSSSLVRAFSSVV
jgi:glycosyltransferase involved in cell wall biosynthesis